VLGAQAFLTAHVANAGPAATGLVRLLISLPDGVVGIPGAVSGDWTCSGTQTVACTHPPLTAGEGTDVTVPLLVNPAAAGGVASARCSSTVADPDLRNNSASVPIGIAARLHPF